MVMDHLPHFRREIRDFTTAARSVAGDAPALPACPGWSMINIVMHLAWVHRYVIDIVASRRTESVEPTDLAFLHLPPEAAGWPTDPDAGPHQGPMPTGLLDWFTDGADTLAGLFATTDPATPVTTWSAEQSVGFWLRMQTIEAAVHRWDAQTGLGTPAPIDTDLAIDMIAQIFEVMVPARRGWAQAPEGQGETFRFDATDAGRSWTVRFDGDKLTASDEPAATEFTGTEFTRAEFTRAEFTGTASDLALFLWHRIPLDTGDPAAVTTWFTLAPPQ
jgi:uncharacterized protein (TIGR03083 family)